MHYQVAVVNENHLARVYVRALLLKPLPKSKSHTPPHRRVLVFAEYLLKVNFSGEVRYGRDDRVVAAHRGQ